MTIKKVKYHRVYEDVIEQIENMIIAGKYKPGDVLPTERELAQSFGISRNTLREAFRILEREGLVETRPGGGRYVSKNLDKEDETKRIIENIEKATILELLEARKIFEVGIVELAAVRATEHDLLEIEMALEKWGVIDRDADESGGPNQSFHLSIAKATHNMVLVNLIELHMDLIRRIPMKTVEVPGRNHEIYEEHRAIFQAIKDRNPQQAKQALLTHLERVVETINENK
ncbi:FadR/GntR family transcriptional regulator [Brevibacillus marinus]|uniref:FadR/GntR family transcriptional regulator n=1 Tax=Brevibacillus marinus TaxID=2496837 RepID=UPI000F846056|nr:FadR/GntR family transcriptional regulator [Brevibacillus marinus]